MAKKGPYKATFKLLGHPPQTISVDGTQEYFDTICDKLRSHYATVLEWWGEEPIGHHPKTAEAD